MKSNNVLITGGAGFIGSHICDYLVDAGNNVVVLDNLSGGVLSNVNKNAIFVKGSINNERLLDRLFTDCNFDFIYHLAAYAAEGLSPFIRKFNYENNLIGSINLINLAVKHKIKHLVFTSSIAVYGTNKTPMKEEYIPNPEDPYGIAKYAVELDLKQASRQFGLRYTIFRPHNVYGERQNISDPYRNVIGIFINKIMNKKALPIFGDGKQKRAFTYFADIIKPIADAPYVSGAVNQIFNLGSDKFYSILDMAKIVSEEMGILAKLEFIAPRLEVKEAFSDHTKAKNAFKLTKETPLEEGIRKMLIWARKTKLKPSRKFKKIEIINGIPKYWLKK